MIRRCVVSIGENKYEGYHVNGTARWDVANKNGWIIKYNGRWDATTMRLIPDARFEERMRLYRKTLEYIGKRFCKSIAWREKLLLHDLYGSYTNWSLHVDYMLDLCILSRDGKHLTLCEKP